MNKKPIVLGPINQTRSYLGNPNQHMTRQQRFNYSKSQLSGTLSYRDLGNGYITFTRETQSHS